MMIAERSVADSSSIPPATTVNTMTNVKTENLFDGLEFPTVPSNKIIINKNDTIHVATASSTTALSTINPINAVNNYDLLNLDKNTMIHHEQSALLSTSELPMATTTQQHAGDLAASSVVQAKKTSNLSTLYSTEVCHDHF